MKRLLRAECVGAFVQNPANMGRQRHIGQQMAHEDPLALIERGWANAMPSSVSFRVAALEFGEAQHLQCFRHRKQLVDLHLQIRGDFGQIRLAIERRGRDRLHQARQQIRGHMRQLAADAQSRESAPGGPAAAPCGRAVIST